MLSPDLPPVSCHPGSAGAGCRLAPAEADRGNPHESGDHSSCCSKAAQGPESHSMPPFIYWSKRRVPTEG